MAGIGFIGLSLYLFMKKNPGSDSKNVNNENYMPKSKAVKGKFIFDPEHGGGRRRRDRKLQRITQEPNEDKIGYDHIKDFKRRID